MTLKGVRSPDKAIELILRPLGYSAAPLRLEDGYLDLPNAPMRVWTSHKADAGYGVLVAELSTRPRSLRRLGRRLIDEFHDTPLAIIGITSDAGAWTEFIVMRPRLISGGGGTVSLAKLHVDTSSPTRHDAEVLNQLRWDAADPLGSQERIDRALDVDRVTKRFFTGLNAHHKAIEAAVRSLTTAGGPVGQAIEAAGGYQRVALRLITQVVFCYFLQRKGLLRGERDWLSRRFREPRDKRYYQSVLEPLFYDVFAVPANARVGGGADSDLPFLNGGLFERLYGDVSLPLDDQLFSADNGLLGFLDGWTFTISEEASDEAEVAVDPEMLGKVFENLITAEEVQREGTVYTPRAVVQFMCREALVPYLQRRVGFSEEQARLLITDDEQLSQLAVDDREQALNVARRIDDAAASLRVLDPAVGSGAFLLGMMTELIRLRSMAHEAIVGEQPSAGDLWRWKRDAIERTLFGVDINPTAIELCRLRLWLSLLVEQTSGPVHPLPNLEYRTICGNSLSDFVAGVEVQQTRSGALTLGLGLQNPSQLVRLREHYFEASDPTQKCNLRSQLAKLEDDFVGDVFDKAIQSAKAQGKATAAKVRERGEQALRDVAEMQSDLHSRDRKFPLFLPAFHAPDVARDGGWHIVIMNPPYVGRKEVRKRFSATLCADLEAHYGRTYDLMLHFAFRALELTRDNGIVSMIFNDSIFTSLDATDVRLRLTADDVRVLSLARTRCFEGQAVNGGVVVAEKDQWSDGTVRWVENHGRPTSDLLGASGLRRQRDDSYEVGDSELWLVPAAEYRRLPHRPLFRPSREARRLLGCFEQCAFWSTLRRWSGDPSHQPDFGIFTDTKRLERWKTQSSKGGLLDQQIAASSFVSLGLVADGGQGLATADDRRFLAAIDGTEEAREAKERQELFESLVIERPVPAERYRTLRKSGLNREDALVALSEEVTDIKKNLGWPRIGLLRVAPKERVHRDQLTPQQVKSGLAGAGHWVPFEKGDSSDEGGAACWRRDNPIVIDWSEEAVALLRARANSAESHRKPYFRNEHLWGRAGVTWNRVASYLRARLVPPCGIFSDKTPTIAPTSDWLSVSTLAALLNAPTTDFLVRTFLGSRMQVEIGDIRRMPIPVLDDSASSRLTDLGSRAIAARQALDEGRPGESLPDIEREIDYLVRDLYGIDRHADLWVVR
jgi:hypothetical protein